MLRARRLLLAGYFFALPVLSIAAARPGLAQVRINGTTTVNPVVVEAAQAQRTADRVACLCVRNGVGELIETACCTDMFSSPRYRETAEYLKTAGTG